MLATAPRAISAGTASALGAALHEVAAYGGPALDLGATDDRRGVDQSRIVGRDAPVVVDLVARHGRAQRQPIGLAARYLVQLLDVLDVDHGLDIGLADPQVDKQVRAPGQRARVPFLQDIDGLLDRTGSGVINPFQIGHLLIADPPMWAGRYRGTPECGAPTSSSAPTT